MASIIPCLLAVVFAIGAANGLKCYSCNSKDSTRCGYGIASFTYPVQECVSAGILDSIAGAKCYKITAKDSDGSEYIARGCQAPPAFGCDAIAKTAGWLTGYSSGNQFTDIQCDVCDVDKCNSASQLTGFTILGLILATIAFLF
ncbi:uncharacterized protein LOC132699831 [Cylas formicarius]|uniref:uncharacterized protein LOC132699831 n=1 Tax=Cylas formicarius TaxID=197179 RepID=UPI0029583460|nr:uncharacterized protein LOC132699831 [Cylas formicarius]